MMQNLVLSEGDIVTLRSATLPKGAPPARGSRLGAFCCPQ